MSAIRKKIAGLRRMTSQMAVAYQHRKQAIPQTKSPRQLPLARAVKQN